MEALSVVFQCHKRPNLTELCLRRLVEMLDGYDHEIIMAYDGKNRNYIKRMVEFCHFKYIVSNENKAPLGALLNKAVELCKYEPVIHFQNDFYWINPCLDDAFKALNYVDIVTFSLFPFSIHNCKKIIDLKKGKLCVFKDGVSFKFNFNPHLRKDRFPAGPFPHRGPWDIEFNYIKSFNKTKKGGGCLCGKNTIHLGLYTSKGGFNPSHVGHFLGYNWNKRINELDPIETFKSLCDNKEYIELFTKHLELQPGGEKWTKKNVKLAESQQSETE